MSVHDYAQQIVRDFELASVPFKGIWDSGRVREVVIEEDTTLVLGERGVVVPAGAYSPNDRIWCKRVDLSESFQPWHILYDESLVIDEQKGWFRLYVKRGMLECQSYHSRTAAVYRLAGIPDTELDYTMTRLMERVAREYHLHDRMLFDRATKLPVAKTTLFRGRNLVDISGLGVGEILYFIEGQEPEIRVCATRKILVLKPMKEVIVFCISPFFPVELLKLILRFIQ